MLKRLFRKLVIVLFVLAFLSAGALWYMTAMPGATYAGTLPKAEAGSVTSLRSHVRILSGVFGARNVNYIDALNQSRDYIAGNFGSSGILKASKNFDVNGVDFYNVEAEIPGESNQLLVVGAHYDTAFDSPGANDNASGVAVLLELAKVLSSGAVPQKTIRLVAFSNEEPPYFNTAGMGSQVYAQDLVDDGQNVVGMLSLETLGFYLEEQGSQKYPFPFSLIYPSTGNFIGFVGDLSSRSFTRQVVADFRELARIPSEGVVSPASIPGIGWSDHSSFWKVGIPALMVTDTAPFRYPHYHQVSDTFDKLDYDRMAILTEDLAKMLRAFN